MTGYALSLALGNTIRSKCIQSTTIGKYINAACDWITDHNEMIPQITNKGVRAPLISAVLKEHKRWESIPNRREPLTKDMLLYIINQALPQPLLSLGQALADWFTLGMQAG